MLELFLGRERFLDEVCVEAAQATHKDAEDTSNYDADKTGPVLLKHFSESLRMTLSYTLIDLWVIR